jgi:hypothetical protein
MTERSRSLMDPSRARRTPTIARTASARTSASTPSTLPGAAVSLASS